MTAFPRANRIGLTALLDENQIRLSWLKNKEFDLENYAIYRSNQPDFNPDSMSSYTYSTVDSFYVDSDFTNGNYYYRVSAIDQHGNESDFSELASVIVTGLDRTNQLPLEYNLFQNYPNPFNPSTVIKFDLSEDTFVNITVYSILGEVVLNLVNSKYMAGSHTILFNANNLKSGIYFYRINTAKYTQIRKMILLK